MRDVSSSFGRFHSIFYRHTSPLPSLVGNIPIAREGLMGKRLYIHHIAIYRKYYGDTIDGTLSKMQIEAMFPFRCFTNFLCALTMSSAMLQSHQSILVVAVR